MTFVRLLLLHEFLEVDNQSFVLNFHTIDCLWVSTRTGYNRCLAVYNRLLESGSRSDHPAESDSNRQIVELRLMRVRLLVIVQRRRLHLHIGMLLQSQLWYYLLALEHLHLCFVLRTLDYSRCLYGYILSVRCCCLADVCHSCCLCIRVERVEWVLISYETHCYLVFGFVQLDCISH